jgi:sugar transferase (PEP-CTERM/EpsH1 system associated)
MKERPRNTHDTGKVPGASPGFFRRLILSGLTLLLMPFIALLAAGVILLNLIDRLARSGRKPAPIDQARPSGIASVVILNWNGRELLAEGLPSVVEAVRRDGRPHEILVVDNGSSDGSVEYMRQAFPQVRVLELPENLGFARGNNAGVRAARHDVVVLLNSDMIVEPGFLRPLLDSFGPNTFAVASQIRHQDPGAIREETGRTAATFRRGLIDYTHRMVGDEQLPRSCYPVFWAGGGSSAFHRERFLMLGGFQEIFSPAYVEDTDLSFQAWRAGWDVLFAPGSIVYHKHRATSGRRFTPRELQTLIQRNQFLFVWKNIRSWSFVLAHCVFLPWNCYRLARDFGLGIWRSLFQAAIRLPSLLAARLCAPFSEARTDAEIFRLLAAPAAFFARSRIGSTACPTEARAPHRVLWLTPYLPHLGKHGGAGRMYHLLKRIAKDYRVTLLTFIEDEEEKQFLPELESMCEKVIAMPRIPPWRWQLFAYEPFSEFFTPAMEQALEDCLVERDFDLIQLEYTQMACYARKAFGTPTLVTLCEVDSAACARRARFESNPVLKMRWFYNHLQVLDRESRLLGRVDAAICVTDADMRDLRKFCASVPIHVINSGVDLEYFRPPERPAIGRRLVFVGAFRHEPNVDAMTYFCKKVLPLVQAQVPGTELYVVGSEPPPVIVSLGSIRGVHVTGFVPDIRPFMAAASVYVAPLRLGAGIRGKILEAWGMAMPVVATTVACAGLRYRDGETLLVADSAEDFAARIVSLLNDPSHREKIGREGRRAAEQGYAWDAVASQLDALYRTYIGKQRPS